LVGKIFGKVPVVMLFLVDDSNGLVATLALVLIHHAYQVNAELPKSSLGRKNVYGFGARYLVNT